MKEKVKEIVLSVGAVAGILALYGIGEILSPSPVYQGRTTNFYGVASKAISDSDMWSSDKAAALRLLLPNAPDAYYQSIISIAGSDMWSSNKLASIKKETEKFN